MPFRTLMPSPGRGIATGTDAGDGVGAAGCDWVGAADGGRGEFFSWLIGCSLLDGESIERGVGHRRPDDHQGDEKHDEADLPDLDR